MQTWLGTHATSTQVSGARQLPVSQTSAPVHGFWALHVAGPLLDPTDELDSAAPLASDEGSTLLDASELLDPALGPLELSELAGPPALLLLPAGGGSVVVHATAFASSSTTAGAESFGMSRFPGIGRSRDLGVYLELHQEVMAQVWSGASFSA